MSEQSSNQDPALQGQAVIAERVSEQLTWLNQAAEIVGGPGAKPDEVFDQPPQERRTARTPNWTPEQEAGVREIAHRFGYGAEHNVPSGLPGGVLIAEGGLAWKIAAEAAAFEDEAGPRELLFAGSPHRVLHEDEHEFLDKRLGLTLPEYATEYDLAHLFARRQAGEPGGQEQVLNFGYELTEGNPTVQQPTGQLVFIGETSKGQSVQLLKVEGAVAPEDESKPPAYRPGPGELMRIMADVTALQGRKQEPIGLATSNSYASRLVDTISAGIKHGGRQFGVAMYGRRTLAEIKGTPIQPATPELNQLPGELRETYDKLQDLSRMLKPKTVQETVDDTEPHPFDPQGHVGDTGATPAPGSVEDDLLNPPQ